MIWQTEKLGNVLAKVKRAGKLKATEYKAEGVSETLCMRVSPCGFDGSFVEPFWI